MKLNFVGWVKRSETQQKVRNGGVGFRYLHPTPELVGFPDSFGCHAPYSAHTDRGKPRPNRPLSTDLTNTGTETTHQHRHGRTVTTPPPKASEDTARPKETAARREENQTTPTQREKDREEGRTPTKEAPAPEAHNTTDPGKGARPETEAGELPQDQDTDTEARRPINNNQTQLIVGGFLKETVGRVY
ncbi:hypothetical protein [Limnospira platensis]|uniref:hypothetical protein n=1 Tax=Limnospira platensis TaxID=118562 RepID=UPI003D6E4105